MNVQIVFTFFKVRILTLAERKSYYEDDYYERPDSFYFF